MNAGRKAKHVRRTLVCREVDYEAPLKSECNDLSIDKLKFVGHFNFGFLYALLGDIMRAPITGKHDRK